MKYTLISVFFVVLLWATTRSYACDPQLEPGSSLEFLICTNPIITFEEGSAELSQAARSSIAKQSVWFKANTKWPITVYGFTDGVGPEGNNRQLAQQRASAIAEALKESGVNPGRIAAVPMGAKPMQWDCRKVDASVKEECLRNNRRTETRLVRHSQ